MFYLVLLLKASHVGLSADHGHLLHMDLQLCCSDEVTPALDELYQRIMDEYILFLWDGVRG